jgi:hypothetical protein
MSWLARLKRQTALDQGATKPTQPPEVDHEAGFVGFVACPPAAVQKIKALKAAANDVAAETLAADPDRCCWPHSNAMNGQEIGTLMARLAEFTDKGLSLEEAEHLADKLVIHDRESDARRLCLECPHLQGRVRWRCGNWEAADAARDGLAPDLVKMLQRCDGYPHATNNGA